MKNYKGKTLVITGAAGGFGHAITKKFAPLKMRFYLLDLANKIDILKQLSEELIDLGAEFATGMVMDVTNKEQINSVINEIGKKEKYIDILIHNAGYGNQVSILNKGAVEDFRKMMAVNVEGPWIITQESLPYIGRPVKKPPKNNPSQREGQIIFISSSAGIISIPNMAAYCSTKHALISLADTIRLEFKLINEKIQVITICPAPTNTNFWSADKKFKKWLKHYETKGIWFPTTTTTNIANAVYKASKGNKNEIMIPRWLNILRIGRKISIRSTDYLILKAEK
ncbi:MAG: SDR family NAD(P)-dependent oxidoreductase [Promethearchaeota archaeon]